jgi:sterol desaturase/sphingolipid hydroxylase (fatty acid hydroxylase superfamily)
VDWLVGLTSGVLPIAYVILVCCVVEQVGALERFSIAARIPGFLMNIVQIVLGAVLTWPIARLWSWLGIGPLVTIPLWRWLQPYGVAGYVLQFLILILVVDFLAYWRHRAEHAWFWPVHAVHHAPTELHAANDIGHPVQVWFSLLFISLPLSLFQIDGPGTPVAVVFIVILLSYYIHSPVSVHFGPLRKVLVDNRFHRIHHSLEERHFDKNFGICFSLWDRLFGTAYDPAPGEWPSVGLASVPAPRSLREFLLLPLHVRRGGGQRADEGSNGQETDPCLISATSSPRS